MNGLLLADPRLHRPGGIGSIIGVDLNLLVMAVIGGLIARDTQRNVSDLRTSIDELSAANLELKRAQEAARQSDGIYHAIDKSLDYGVWMWAPDGRNIYCSTSLLKLIGATQEAAARFDWADVLHPEDREKTVTAWRECVRKQALWETECRIRTADGAWRHILSRGGPVRDDDGRITCWAGITLDISALKQAQQSLLSSESEAKSRAAELQALMDAVPAAIFITDDPECQHIGGNRRAYDLFRQQPGGNLSKSAPVGQMPTNFHMIRDGVEIPPSELPMQVAARMGRPVRNQEMRMVFDDGTCIDLLSNAEPMLDSNGRPRGAVAVVTDITDRKLAADTLCQNEARLREAAHIASIGYISWDANKDETTWSEEMFRIMNWPPDKRPPTRAERELIYTPESWRRFDQVITRALEFGEPYELDLDVVRPDGSIRHTHARGAAERDMNGRVVRLYGTLQDVTERKLAEMHLRRTQWAESFRLLSRGIAHDFNNLLGAILAETELALLNSPGQMPAFDEIRRIQGLARRASEIVRQLMIYSGHEKPSMSPVDLSALVQDMLDLLHSVIPKTTALDVQLGAEIPTFMADAAQLRQVIMNLVINAAEAIGAQQGAIKLRTRLAQLASNQVVGVPPGDYVQLEIGDSGCGMPEETRARIFQPFFSTKGDGRGLGLATTQTIVRDNGGFIDVASSPGRGSRFSVLFPCSAASPAKAPALSRGSDSIALHRAASVLVVEDQEALRIATSKILAKKGFKVLQAADGNTALACLHSEKLIDLVLLDFSLPGVASREVLRHAHLLHPDVKVVLTTAFSHEIVMGSFEGAQLAGFIRKPYQMTELVKVLQDALPREHKKLGSFAV
jgi:PAS domain S-box-containing protein